MRVPTFYVERAEDNKETLADVPEWILVECDFQAMRSVIRFRIGDFAYSTDAGSSPIKQAPAGGYAAKKVIGQIICK